MNFLQKLFSHSPENEADHFFEAGWKFYDAGQYMEAIESFQKAKSIYQSIGDLSTEGKTLGNLANCYRILGNYAKAMQCNEQRLAIARKIDDQAMIGRALGDIGTLHEAQGDHKNALAHYQQHLAIAQKIQNKQDIANAIGNVGNAHYHLSEFKEALHYQIQSLNITREVQDVAGEIQSLTAIGNTYLVMGELAKAIEYQKESLKIAESTSNDYFKSYTLGNLGQAYMSDGQYGLAIDCFETSLATLQKVKDRRGEAQALGNLGAIYDLLGDHAKSADYREQMLVIMRQLGDKMFISQALTNLGATYLASKDLEKGFAKLQESLELKREISDRRGEAIVLGNLSIYYSLIENPVLAEGYRMQSLSLAKSIDFTPGVVQTLVVLGVQYYTQGLYNEALASLQEALSAVQKMGDARLEAILFENLGRVFFRLGRIEESEQMLWAGIKILESLRNSLGFDDANKISLFDTQQKAYHWLQKVLVKQGKTDTALEVAERARARAFVELLDRRNITLELPLQATSALTIDQVRAIAKTQNATIIEYSLVYLYDTGKDEHRSLDLFIWAIDPSGKIHFKENDWSAYLNKDVEKLEDFNTGLFDAIGVRGRGLCMDISDDSNNALHEIYMQLIHPIADFLPKNEQHKIVFIPQYFTSVPFCALLDENGKYLIENHTILTAPSIQILDLAHQRKNQLSAAAVSEALVVGNPIMPILKTAEGKIQEILTPLFYAEQEALEIAKLLNTKAFIKEQATKVELLPKMQKARIIHLATHGLLDDFSKREIPGALALAPSNTDTGLLTSEEILSLELQADLVVLSACSSAQGRVTSDGVIGLSRAFFSAGAASVIVSLWAVPDQSTAYLMIEFYKNLQSLGDKAQALRKAMLSTMKIDAYRAPKNWAAFTLIGEP